MDPATRLWWGLLSAVALGNALGWCWAARRQRALAVPLRSAQGLQLLLAGGYVLGCGYRSLLPVFDVPRIVLVDSWASSVLIGRSVATVAELCFAAQWALLLAGVGRVTRHAPTQAVARLVLPIILLAETCSWASVLTTANLGHALEESLWGAVAVLLGISLVLVLPRCERRARPWLLALGVSGLAYAGYMFGVDVPMYWSRWVADEAGGQAYLSFAQGVHDAASRWTVRGDWALWRGEAMWMTLYFSVGVWFSLALTQLRPEAWAGSALQATQGETRRLA